MNENLASVELLPKGAFLITRVNGEKITGRFSMPVLEQFCESKGIENYLDAINKIAIGMTVTEYAELLSLAIKESGDGRFYQTKKVDDKVVFDRKIMLEFIDDEFDGVSEGFLQLILHAVGRLGKKAKLKEVSKEEDEELKKNTSQASTGTNSGSDVSERD